MSYSRLNRREFVSRGRSAVVGPTGSAGSGGGITSIGGDSPDSLDPGPGCLGSGSNDGCGSSPGSGSVSAAGLLLANRPGPVNGLFTTAGIRTRSSPAALGFVESAAICELASSSGDLAAGHRVAEGSKAKLLPASFGFGGVRA